MLNGPSTRSWRQSMKASATSTQRSECSVLACSLLPGPRRAFPHVPPPPIRAPLCCILNRLTSAVVHLVAARTCRLWHQLSVALEEFIKDPGNHKDGNIFEVSPCTYSCHASCLCHVSRVASLAAVCRVHLQVRGTVKSNSAGHAGVHDRTPVLGPQRRVGLFGKGTHRAQPPRCGGGAVLGHGRGGGATEAGAVQGSQGSAGGGKKDHFGDDFHGTRGVLEVLHGDGGVQEGGCPWPVPSAATPASRLTSCQQHSPFPFAVVLLLPLHQKRAWAPRKSFTRQR